MRKTPSVDIQSNYFPHRIHKRARNPLLHEGESSKHITIYLHGDGVPWVGRFRVAKDPTPSRPLTWGLFVRHPKNETAWFINRPCYFLMAESCEPLFWTRARYSEKVVESLAQAIEKALPKNHTLTLVGFSGGGSLAVLLAERLSSVTKIVTIAANINHPAWTRRHTYGRLSRSLNAGNVVLPNHIEQIHYHGEKDKNVPSSINTVFFEKNQVKPRIIPEFTHGCCWTKRWPALLYLEDVKAI